MESRCKEPCLYIFKLYMKAVSFPLLLSPQDELDWGKENFIQIKRIREVQLMETHYRTPVSSFIIL